MKILLGVCGGIAAYKAAELTRELRRRGFDIQVAMTEAAQRFVTPLTFATLSAHPVLTSLWQPVDRRDGGAGDGEFTIDHTRVAQEIDACVIAPATANTLARLAHGMADDPLTAVALATRAPLFLAPAMNDGMWQHPATQQNLEILQARGARVIPPESGSLACGVVGPGRLAEPAAIADVLSAALQRAQDLRGQHVLVTAGGTREPIDAVRYIGNRSSGKMGHALAEAASARGAAVTLITAAAPPLLPGCAVISVDTAAAMQDAVLQYLDRATMVLMAAAVADFRVAAPQAHKIKKSATLTLDLVRNDDILQKVSVQRSAGTLVIGFAAETQDLLAEARRKLREKGLDAIVANDVSQTHAGFDSDRNAGVFLSEEREVVLPLTHKRQMAEAILDEALHLVPRTAALIEVRCVAPSAPG